MFIKVLLFMCLMQMAAATKTPIEEIRMKIDLTRKSAETIIEDNTMSANEIYNKYINETNGTKNGTNTTNQTNTQNAIVTCAKKELLEALKPIETLKSDQLPLINNALENIDRELMQCNRKFKVLKVICKRRLAFKYIQSPGKYEDLINQHKSKISASLKKLPQNLEKCSKQ